MMNELEKRATEIERKRQKILSDVGLSVKIGDTVIRLSYYFGVAKVEDIEINEENLKCSVLVCRVIESDKEYGGWDVGNIIKIKLSHIVGNRTNYHVVRNTTYAEIEKEAQEIIEDKRSPIEPSQESTETALVSTSKNDIIAMSDMLMAEEQKCRAVYEVLKNKLEQKRNEMNAVLKVYEKTVTKIRRVIRSIELYLGVNEDICQINDGIGCDNDTPITIRQHELYMDVEAADPWNASLGGITGDNIEPFLEWIVKYDEFIGEYNYKTILPERGICVFRVRQTSRERYSNDGYYAALEKMRDRNTVIIIRNGEKLYFIQSDLNFMAKMFPDKDEMIKIITEGKDVFGDELDDEEKAAKVKDTLYAYKIQMMVLQGIIDRTDIFKPFSEGVNLFDSNVLDGNKISLIYDGCDGFKLTDGMPDFEQWRKQRIGQIKTGSRIFLFGRYDDYHADRFFRWYNERDHPDFPSIGVYLLEYDSETKKNFIRYKPKEGVRSWDWSVYGSERKNNVRFEIRLEDPFIISYDALRNDEIEWIRRMMIDRRNRYYNKYISLMKPLYKLYMLRKEDMENEYHLLRLIEGITGVDDENVILDAILWWKTKNKYKRPIGEDESKAVRMIASKVKRLVAQKNDGKSQVMENL